MRKIRLPVLIAWLFCAVVVAVSIISSVSTLAQMPSSEQPNLLFGEAAWNFLPMLFAIPAALIISHQPRNVIGWLLMTLPLVALPVDVIDRYLLSLPSPPVFSIPLMIMATFSSFSWVALIFPLLFIPLFFPTGRLLSPGWRWVLYLAAGMALFLVVWGLLSKSIFLEKSKWTIANPYGVIPEGLEMVFAQVWSLLLVVLTVTCLSSIFVRYRRAGAVEREQMKWLLYACAVFGLVYVPSLFLHSDTNASLQGTLIDLLFLAAICTIPAAITIAILRYHLFDIDVIIRLTVVYATVTALLGLAFAGGVALLQEVFRSLTGQTSEMAVLVTTLAIAALFNPLRQRVQEMINRRFYRQKYDADQAIAEFAAAARSGADLYALTDMLTELVATTLEPSQVSLLLRAKKREGGE